MDDTHLIEADLVVDDENLLIETEIQDVDDIDVDKDVEEDFVATPGYPLKLGELVLVVLRFRFYYKSSKKEGCEMVKIRDVVGM
ncbi:hypothetical protein Tco_1125772 [Tanacetum coccineum]